jgi:hypothetical protein
MSSEDRPETTDSPETSTPPREPTDEQALLRLFQAPGSARRPRQRRLLIVVGALVTASVLITAVMSRTRDSEAPSTPSVMEPPEPSSGASGSRTARSEPPTVPSAPPAVPSAPPAVSSAPPTVPPAPPAVRPAPPAVRPAPPAVRSAPPAVRPAPPAVRKSGPTTTREPEPPPSAAPAPTPRAASVSYQPRERLTRVRPGDAKHRIFELFPTAFEQRTGSLVRVEGMRLRASGRSPHHAQVEVAEVKIADSAGGALYWFLFGDGLLLAWGRPEEWSAANRRYQLEIDYRPDPSRARRPGAT